MNQREIAEAMNAQDKADQIATMMQSGMTRQQAESTFQQLQDEHLDAINPWNAYYGSLL